MSKTTYDDLNYRLPTVNCIDSSDQILREQIYTGDKVFTGYCSRSKDVYVIEAMVPDLRCSGGYLVTKLKPLGTAMPIKSNLALAWFFPVIIGGTHTKDEIKALTSAVVGAIIIPSFPHTCPKCKGPAYIGFSSIDCSRKCS